MGHRFLSRGEIEIATADAYEETLRAEGKVIASFAERRTQIVCALEAAASGATILMPDALLDEVTALVEWPAVYAGTFDRAFLAVPQECLILTMQQNQKYFALADAAGRLTNRFLIVSNLATADPSAIIQGNERVLRARLADAEFFFDQDRKTRLASRVDRLRSIVYHNKLGTQADRMDRVRNIATRIAPLLGADAELADRAAMLAKADLVTDMVGEFPELQGVMGRYYALHDGEPAPVADAIAQHYWPRFAGDALPDGRRRAIRRARRQARDAGGHVRHRPGADRRQGSVRAAPRRARRDPHPDRKGIGAAAACSCRVRLQGVRRRPGGEGCGQRTACFIYDRLRGYLRDLGYTANQIAAVVDAEPADIHLVPARLAAVQSFESLPESGALAAANKRIVNILRKADGDAAIAVDRGRLAEGAEHDLWLAFQKLEPAVDADCGARRLHVRADGARDGETGRRPLLRRRPRDGRRPGAPRQPARAAARRRATMNRVADISKLAT